MNALPRHLRFTRALVLGCAAIAACESSRETAPNAASATPTSSGDRASSEPDAGAPPATNDQPASVSDAGMTEVATAPSPPLTGVTTGAPCSPAGATQTFGDPRDRTHCTCFANGARMTWNCYTDSMTVEGPLAPPELEATSA
jgi:hypothetical protein